MLSIDSFIRNTKFRSKNIDPETGKKHYSEMPKPEQIELVRVEEKTGIIIIK